jgi:hypothetical protein
MYVRSTPFSSDKYRLLVNPVSIKAAEAKIIFLITNLVPQFERDFPSPKLQTPKTTRSATSKSKPKPFFQSRKYGKDKSPDKK